MKKDKCKGKKYTLPTPPPIFTPPSTPNVLSPAPSFTEKGQGRERAGNTRRRSPDFRVDELLPVIEEGAKREGTSETTGTRVADVTLSLSSIESYLPEGSDNADRQSDRQRSATSTLAAAGGTPERTRSQVSRLRQTVKRSYTENDIALNGREVSITIDSGRGRSSNEGGSGLFHSYVQQQRWAGNQSQLRKRSATMPDLKLMKTEGSIPRVLSAVNELDKSLAEEKLAEIEDVTNLAELDLKIVKETRTPRGTISSPSSTQPSHSTLKLSKSGHLEVTSPTITDEGGEAAAATIDHHSYGETIQDMQDEDIYLSPDLPLERVASLCQRCAAICTLNIMHQKEYTLRSATESKLFMYQIVTSKGYHLLMLSISIFHVILASFEPASVDMLSSDNKYVEMAKDQVLIIETIIVFLYVFDICIGRILSTNKIFWRQKLNMSRILCTGIMGVDLVLAYINVGVPRFSRFLRPMQCILLSANLYSKLISVLQAGLAAGKALSLLLLTIFVFSLAGMEFFSNSKDWIQFSEEQITCGFDFSDIYHSFVSLFVLLTTENYPCVMMPAIRGKIQLPKENNYVSLDNVNFDTSQYSVTERNGRNFTELTATLYSKLKSEGHVEKSRTLHVMFFVTFLLVTTFGVLNVLIASVYNTYRGHAIQTSYIKRTKERKSLLIAYELLTMNKMMSRESMLGIPFESKEEAYLDYLTFRDLVRMTMGNSINDEKLEFYWNKIDTDKSGYVDPLEFLSLVDVLGLTLFRVCETNLAKISHKSIWRTQLKRLVFHSYFRRSIFCLLLGNAVLLCTKGIVSPGHYGTILIVNDVLSLVYLMEMFLKIAALGREFWSGVWNQFDCLTIGVGVLAAIVRLKPVADYIGKNFLGSLATFVCMLSKVLRVLRLTTIGKKESNQFLLLLFRILPTSLTFLVLTFLVCCVYAYIGIEIFTKFNQGNFLQNDYYEFASFSNFSKALMLMFQVLTMSNWHEIMLEADRVLALQLHPTIAFLITAVYFISFGILSVNIVLHLMQAVFVDSWRQIIEMNAKLKRKLVQVRNKGLVSESDGQSFHSQHIKDSILFSQNSRGSQSRTFSQSSL